MPYNPPRPKAEPKVKAATTGAGVGGVLVGLVLWALSDFVFTGPDGIPTAVTTAVVVLIPTALTYLAGYYKHSQTGGEHRADT